MLISIKDKITKRTAYLCCCVFFFTAWIFAGDGVIDIRPTGVETLIISSPGSYVLTDNVTMSANVSCINITASDVFLDLNGHTLTGNGSSLYGINGAGMERIHVSNGIIRNFSSKGIVVGSYCRVSDLIVQSNGDNGLDTGEGSHIFHVTVVSNKGNGIKTGAHCLVESCVARSNGSKGGKAGIYAGNYCTIKDSVCDSNSNTTNTNVDSYGIYAGAGSTILGNTCYSNNNSTTYNGGKAYGIYVSNGSTVSNNACFQNQGINQGTDGIGIYAASGSNVTGNTCSDNNASADGGDSIGISCGAHSVIKDNTCRNNHAHGATLANAVGIAATEGSIVTGNNCTANNGTTSSIGIRVGANGNRVENNLCSTHTEGSGTGIYLYISLSGSSIVKNTTLGNDTGIDLGGGVHYCAENICTDGIINDASSTLGTGDRSNIEY